LATQGKQDDESYGRSHDPQYKTGDSEPTAILATFTRLLQGYGTEDDSQSARDDAEYAKQAT
jgi:hypothetical protein